METSWLVAALLSGLFSVGHCLPMCGGLVTLLAQGVASKPFGQRLMLVLALSIGRVATYTALGLGLGAVVQAAVMGSGWQTLAELLRLLSGVLLILMGLYVGRFWFGLSKLERIGARLWPRLQPAMQQLRALRHPGQALAAGALWGLLPCGLVYSALATAAARADANEAAMFMLMFGLGTLPVLTMTGLMASPRTRPLPAALRLAAGLALIALGIWVSLMSLDSMQAVADPHQDHSHHHSITG